MKILLIQDNPEYFVFLKDALAGAPLPRYELENFRTLAAGLERIARGGIEIVLLDLSLPDEKGFGTFERVKNQFPDVPVVILSDWDDEMTAFKAVRGGAEDYLLKSEVDGKLLRHVMRYAVERHKVRKELINMSFIDDLTGLYNRRGFLILAEQQMKLAYRSKRQLLLILADLDGLKQVNDLYGHREGDLALTKTAVLLKETFRKSDIVSRIGGDEFAILAVDADQECGNVLVGRLQKSLTHHNETKSRPYTLAASVGICCFDTKLPVSVEQMMATADEALYESKRHKKGLAVPKTA